MQFFCLLIIAPTVVISITDNGSTADIGMNFSLSCLIFGHENLANTSVQYQWLRSDSALDDYSSILTLPSLKLSDAGLLHL